MYLIDFLIKPLRTCTSTFCSTVRKRPTWPDMIFCRFRASNLWSKEKSENISLSTQFEVEHETIEEMQFDRRNILNRPLRQDELRREDSLALLLDSEEDKEEQQEETQSKPGIIRNFEHYSSVAPHTHHPPPTTTANTVCHCLSHNTKANCTSRRPWEKSVQKSNLSSP